jgi:3-hydroxyisobutyrate dehydrogenase-like beta-hydroxyacid dehydrogenase
MKSEQGYRDQLAQVGVVGLGAMGGGIAARLLANGVRTVVCDVRTEAVARLVELGAIAGTLGETAGCDVLITSLPTEDIVRETLSQELFERLSPGVLIEMSTTSPMLMREVSGRAEAAGVGVVDCPVSGGSDNARDGTLVCLVGSSYADLDRVRTILEMLGSIEHVGDVGDGKAIKLVNNMISIGNAVVAIEGFALGLRLGIDPSRLYDVLSRSGAQSLMLRKKIPIALEGDFTPGFAVRLAAKDLRLAIGAGDRAGAWLPAANLVREVLESAEKQGFQDDDLARVMRLFED